MLPFVDRRDAARRLFEGLEDYRGATDALVLGLPRGGVPVAFEVAREFDLPLDVLVVRKLGVPGHEELAAGAIAWGGVRVLNPEVAPRVDETDLAAVEERERAELRRREEAYRGDRPFPDLAGRRLILVDDGLATGATMRAAVRAAVRAVREREPAEIAVAAPVGPPDAAALFEGIADRVVCPESPAGFRGIGQFYEDFAPTTDEEVKGLLARARRG